MNKEDAVSYVMSNMARDVYSSTRMEYCDFGYDIIELVLNSDEEVSISDSDKDIIFHFKDAWIAMVDSFGEPLDVDLVQKITAITEYGRKAWEEGARSDFTNWDKVKNILEMNSSIEDVEQKAAVLFCNMRLALSSQYKLAVSQLLASKLLLEAGIGIMRVPTRLGKEFTQACLNEILFGKQDLKDYVIHNCVRRL